MVDENIQIIIEFLDKYLTKTGRDHITPVEANQLLAKANLLGDSQQRPGKPLRDLLRGGKLPHAYQSGGKGSGWIIPVSSSEKRTKSTDNQSQIQDDVNGTNVSGFGAGLSAADAIDLRQLLLDVYGSRCPITGCDITASLEVALFVPFLGSQTYHIANGTLLRADLRVLFELHKLTIDPDSFEVLLAPQLESTTYSDLKGVAMSLPEQPELQPDARAVKYHYDQFMKISK